MGESKASGMFGAGSAVLRGVIAAPLEAVRRRAGVQPDHSSQSDQVNTIIESEIIPRLLMAHTGAGARSRRHRFRTISPDEASRFAELPLRLEAASLLAEVDAFIATGASVETICLDRLARQPFDLLGLTLARDCPSAAVRNLITAVRNVSANPHIIVLVGGRMINENPSIAIEVGSDGTGADALAALELANSLVMASANRALNLG